MRTVKREDRLSELAKVDDPIGDYYGVDAIAMIHHQRLIAGVCTECGQQPIDNGYVYATNAERAEKKDWSRHFDELCADCRTYLTDKWNAEHAALQAQVCAHGVDGLNLCLQCASEAMGEWAESERAAERQAERDAENAIGGFSA
jgi:hypothetical protein